MKTKHIIFAVAGAVLLSFQSCSLNEDTSGISSPDDFFRKFSE